jgi:outer membrane protein assembly factor BamB
VTNKKKLFGFLIMAIWVMMPVLADSLQSDQQTQFPELKGEYLGQKKPGTTPEVFAPGIVSTPSNDSTPVFSSDGKEVYWGRAAVIGQGMIMYSRVENGRWTMPQPLPFLRPDFPARYPALSCDGRTLIFSSTRPIEGIPADKPYCSNLWMSEKTDTGWTEPVPISGINTSADEDCPILTSDGTLYFQSGDNYRSRLVNGHYGNREKLPDLLAGVITYVAPDQSCVIFSSRRPGGFSPFDAYISFRQKDSSWGQAINLGKTVNTFAPLGVSVSPDGKYLFFISERNGNLDVYWMDAKFIDDLRKGIQESQKPNFSGAWRFNPEKSKLQIPAPTSSTFRVDHREPEFHLSRTHVYEGKADTWSIDLTTDGKEVVQQEGDRTIHSRLYWEGNELVFDSKIVLKDREATNIVRYQLSEDGKTFTAIERFRGPILKYDNIWVFDKQ